MVVTATYGDGGTAVVSGWSYDPTTALDHSNTTITVSYTIGDTTKMTSTSITIQKILLKIEITSPPSKIEYITGDAISTSGMAVIATYSDGSTANVTSSCSINPTTASGNSFTVSYTYNSITKTAVQNITVVTAYSVLNDNSWETIKAVSNAGTGSNYWSVGDTKTITVSGTVGTKSVSGSYNVYILGFNHNTTYEPSGISFGCFKTTGGVNICLIDENYGSSTSATGALTMNTSSTNYGGWGSCKMRSNNLGSNSSPSSPGSNTLLAALPSDLRAVMKAITKYTDNTGGGGGSSSSFVTSTTDYLPLFSEYEIFGSRTYANTYEASYQKQYSFYSAGNSKIRYQDTSTSTSAVWWLRSPYSSDASAFCYVHSGGSAGANSAYYSRGVAAILVV